MNGSDLKETAAGYVSSYKRQGSADIKFSPGSVNGEKYKNSGTFPLLYCTITPPLVKKA